MRRSVMQAAIGLLVLALVAGLFLRQTRRARGPHLPPRPAVSPVQPTQAQAEAHLTGTWVDVPSQQPDAPLVLLLHGRGDTPGHFAAIAGHLGSHLAFRALEAPWPFHEGHAWFRSDPPDVLRADLEADYPALLAQIEHARPRPVALFGFSQGCMLAAHFAVAHPEAVRAIVCVGGALKFEPPVPPPGTPRPAFLFVHGTADPMVPIASARAAAQALDSRGFKTEFLEHRDGHTVPDAQGERIRTWLEAHLQK
jgi:phospholipase/carboxylesterase